MPCLFVIIASFFPRVALIVIALMTSWFSSAFNTRIWPILGFLFMPYTTLIYMAAMLNNHHTLSGFWLALVIVAVFCDLSTHGGSTRVWRRR
jgi:hypothetical protein